jgi:hypothetical protein
MGGEPLGRKLLGEKRQAWLFVYRAFDIFIVVPVWMNQFNGLKTLEGLDGYGRKARRSQFDAAFEMIHVISLARLAGSTKQKFEIKSYKDQERAAHCAAHLRFPERLNLVVSEAVASFSNVLTDEV